MTETSFLQSTVTKVMRFQILKQAKNSLTLGEEIKNTKPAYYPLLHRINYLSEFSAFIGVMEVKKESLFSIIQFRKQNPKEAFLYSKKKITLRNYIYLTKTYFLFVF